MSDRAAPRRRRRGPLLLLSAVLVLLALGTVLTAQLYWLGLHEGVEQMRVSMAAAQQEQRRLMARVQSAEAALAERVAAMPAPADAAATPVGQSGTPHKPRAPSPPNERPLRQGLRLAERGQMSARLEALEREALRLPPEWESLRRRASASAHNKQLLRDQLAVAAAAAAANDIAWLDAALFSAHRLTGAPHRTPDGGGAAIAAELAALRERLREPRPSAPSAPAVPPSARGTEPQTPTAAPAR